MRGIQQLVNVQIDASGLLTSQRNVDGQINADMEVSKEYTPAMPPPQHLQPAPQIVIAEQPHPKLHRFRYQSEQRGSTAGSILGVRTTGDRPTYPTLEIQHYVGPAKVVISCLSTDESPRLHPYRLIGRPDCRHGLCVIRVGPESGMTCSINNLAVQSVLKKDVGRELDERQRHYRNPFNVPVGDASTIDLKKVRLCFELYLETTPGKFQVVNPPVLSDTIYDRKYNPDLVINEMSHCRAPVSGGKQIMLLTDTVSKEEVRVRFFEDRQDQRGPWIAYGTVKRVHKHVAIVLDTPAYDDLDITSSVMVQVQLERTSDSELSKSLSFEIHPSHSRVPKQEVASPQPTPGPSYQPNITSILSLEEFLRQPFEEMSSQYPSLQQFNQNFNHFAAGNATRNAPVTDATNALPQLSSLENILGLPPVHEINPRLPDLQQYNFSGAANAARNAQPVTEQDIENLSCEMLDIALKDLTDL